MCSGWECVSVGRVRRRGRALGVDRCCGVVGLVVVGERGAIVIDVA